jgi:hypothetical protein
LLQAAGFDAKGINTSPVQAALARAAGVARVCQGDFRAILAAHSAHYAATTATDLLKHLTQPKVPQTFDDAAAALLSGGVIMVGVPDAVSPLRAHIRDGDFTHRTSSFARSTRQLTAAAGFDMALVRSCSPVAHRLNSAVRVMVWEAVNGFHRIAWPARQAQLRGHIVTENLTVVASKSAQPVNPADTNPV